MPPPIVLIAFDGVEPLEVVGPASVFSLAKKICPSAPELIIASPDGGGVNAECGIFFNATVALADLSPPYDLVIVAGGTETALSRLRKDGRVAAWLKRARPASRRIASVCSGAFVLASAGLLEGKKVTAHWRSCQRLQGMYPNVKVQAESIYVMDGDIYTSAGASAAMDLALAIVAEDHGAHVAAEIARELVLFLRRPGDQAQFSASLIAQTKSSERMGRVIAHVTQEPAADLGVPALAKLAGMSVRNFARAFKEEQGTSPAAFVSASRLEHAKHLLSTTRMHIDEVAYASGFSAVDTLQRVFRTKLRTTPRQYRERFSMERKVHFAPTKLPLLNYGSI